MLASACYFAAAESGQAAALAIAETQQLSFGQIRIPGGVETVTINSSGVITVGSQWVVSGPSQAGEFIVSGTDGLIDIEVLNISTCDASVDISNFTGTFGSGADPLVDIDITPTSGIQLGAGNGGNMELGATISFNQTTPAGACTINYDIQITYT